MRRPSWPSWAIVLMGAVLAATVFVLMIHTVGELEPGVNVADIFAVLFGIAALAVALYQTIKQARAPRAPRRSDAAQRRARKYRNRGAWYVFLGAVTSSATLAALVAVIPDFLADSSLPPELWAVPRVELCELRVPAASAQAGDGGAELEVLGRRLDELQIAARIDDEVSTTQVLLRDPEFSSAGRRVVYRVSFSPLPPADFLDPANRAERRVYVWSSPEGEIPPARPGREVACSVNAVPEPGPS